MIALQKCLWLGECSYMVMKNEKLHQQFDAEACSSSHSGCSSGKPIFQGVSIFVDGYTVPSSQVFDNASCFMHFFCFMPVLLILPLLVLQVCSLAHSLGPSDSICKLLFFLLL